MAQYQDEMFIITGDEMQDLKAYAQKLLDALPKEQVTALLTVTFLKEVMEQQAGKKVKGIQVINKVVS